MENIKMENIKIVNILKIVKIVNISRAGGSMVKGAGLSSERFGVRILKAPPTTHD